MKVIDKKSVMVDAFKKMTVPTGKKPSFHPVILTKQDGGILTMKAADSLKVVAMDFSWKPAGFEPDAQDTVVMDGALILSLLQRMNEGQVTLNLENDRIKVTTDKREGTVRPEGMTGEAAKLPSYSKFAVKWEVDAQEIEDAIEEVSSVDFPCVNLVHSSGATYVEVGSLTESNVQVRTRLSTIATTLKEGVGDFTVTVPMALRNVLSVLEGKVELYLAPKYPLGIGWSKDGISVKYYITPLGI